MRLCEREMVRVGLGTIGGAVVGCCCCCGGGGVAGERDDDQSRSDGRNTCDDQNRDQY